MSLIGIDVGTSAVKAAAYNEAGLLIAVTRAAASPVVSEPGRWELHPQDVWSAALQALGELTAHPQVRFDPPRALAVSASGDEVFPVNAAGEPLGSCILSGDMRGSDLEAEMAAWATDMDWYGQCGHVPERMDPGLRILWWRRHQPQIFAEAHYFLDWHAFFMLRLCGEVVTDKSLAAKALLFDATSGAWSADRARQIGIEVAAMPRVQDWGTAVGTLKRDLRQQLGLPADVLVAVGAFDASCAALGAGASMPGAAGLACGSWEVIVAPADTITVTPALVSARFPIVAHPGRTQRAVLAQSPNGTSVIDWSVKLLNADLVAISNAVQATTQDPGPVLAIPHLSGAISSWFEGRDSRAAFLGMTLATTPTDLVKALMESIAFDLTLTLTLLTQIGVPCQVLRAAGGGTRSAWWMQLKADLSDIPLEVVEQPEPGTFGAALLAGSAMGAFESAGAAAERLVRVSHHYVPDRARAQRYAHRLAVYQDAVAQLIPLQRSLEHHG